MAIGVSYTPSSLVTTTLFRRSTFSTAGSGCSTYTQAVRFTLVDLDPGSLDTNQNSSICNNTIPNTISSGASGSQALSSIGTITYQWQKSINNASWTSIASATQEDYSAPSLLENTYLRRIAYSTIDSFVCSATTNAILISVHDEVRAGSILGDQIICEESIPTPLSLMG